jgi:hypothetical protein
MTMAQPALPAPTNDAGRSSPGLAAKNTTAGQKRKRTTERKFYAVREGKEPGIYDTWPECLSQVKGFKGAVCMNYSEPGDVKLNTDMTQSKLFKTFTRLKLGWKANP